MRHLNLVFQGGGVKGIAYAGALQALPRQEFRIRGIGGTSAGAIVAGLLAIGKRDEDLKKILSDPELFVLLAERDAARYARFKEVTGRYTEFKALLDDAQALWSQFGDDRWFGVKKLGALSTLGALRKKHKPLLDLLPTLIEDLRECWTGKGVHESMRLRVWLDKVLEDKTFGDCSDFDLRIVATDVTRRDYITFDSAKDKGMPIAYAVHASVSIPIFFRPLESATECFVDGGVLSNFPSFLFNQSPYPTVGFRLTEHVARRNVNSPLQFLLQLIETMATAHDKRRELPPYFHSYKIDTPPHIPFDKFNLEERDVNELFNIGVTVGQRVKWEDDEHSSTDELIGYFDPNAHRVLHVALQEAGRLIAEHLSPQRWVEAIQQLTTLRVRIDNQWNASYERLDTITVSGERSLFLQRSVVKVPASVGRKHSLADTRPACEEVLSDGSAKPLVYLPAFNTEDAKGFLVIYSPPIGGSDRGPRTIRTLITIPKEFESSVGKGDKGFVSLNVIRRAAKHELQTTIEILVEKAAAELDFNPLFTAERKNDFVTKNGKTYLRYTWAMPLQPLESITFPLVIELKRVPYS